MRYDVAMSVSDLTPSSSSTRPYLLRALYEWCTDNGFTPYIAAYVDDTVQVPREHVKNNEIVLNISMDATSSLKLGNEFVEFKARFSGSAREIMVPIDRVIAIYARENGQGMAFPVPQSVAPRGEIKESEHMQLSAVPKADMSASDSATSASSTASPAAAKVMQLVSVNTEGPTDEPPPPAGGAPAGPRPSLKRVK
jgi:stringent starvation protein B